MKPGVLAPFLLVFLWTGASQAQPAPLRMDGRQMVANLKLSAMITPAFERKMRSGLTQRILYRVLLREDPGGRVVAAALRYCNVTFDLWEENWSVECAVQGSVRSLVVARYPQLLIHVAALQDFRFPGVFQPSAGRRYWVEVEIQVNPISRQLLDKVKMWLRQSERGSQFSGYMGSVLSLFVDKSISGADMVFRVESKKVWGRELP